MDLRHLTDKTLLLDTKSLAQQYRYVTTKLLPHLKEIDKRKLYCDLKYPSLFEYVVRELGFSEPSAARRINAARLLNDMPEIEEKIESGILSLSNLSTAAKTFREEHINDTEQKRGIIKQIENLSTRECEKKLQELHPHREKLKKLTFQISDDTFVLFEEVKDLIPQNFNQDEFISYVLTIVKKYKMKKKFGVD